MIRFKKYSFHPVIKLPEQYDVFDFSKGYDSERELSTDYGIGKYNEKRPNMYKGEHYEKDQRDIHMGIDIMAPLDTPIYAFFDGVIYKQTNNNRQWDYGYTIVCAHNFEGDEIYSLLGHLSANSIFLRKEGESFRRGEILGYVGSNEENGGWNPHLHFQLSLTRPAVADMPGVVSDAQLERALKIYPDPRLVLGPVY